MAYANDNGTNAGNNRSKRGFNFDYSGDERDSRSGGEETRFECDLNGKPIYLLEHLATFTVNRESGIVYPADGMRRLLQLEKTTGIWSQKMQLCLNYPWILIMDYETENIIERFPASLIQEPTAFTSTDAMELYNNILVFIVSGGNGSRSEMHIFQCQSAPAVQLVEDLKNLRTGKKISQPQDIQTESLLDSGGTHKILSSEAILQQHRNEHIRSQQNINQYPMGEVAVDLHGHGNGHGETDSEHGGGGINDETSSTSSDKYERDVTVLNHCFDDIEKFIARLQHAAAASRELERRRRNRKTKKKDPGEGLLTLRARPPHEKEFVDIFAKFKLSFNLLAKLKAHIHDPNAPELVHFLFTPLALIVEAASDTYYELQLTARVTNPLLTREAINLLINCVTSKETELWRSLGDAWVIPRDQWKDAIGSYHPVFLDGWSPDYLVIDELDHQTMASNNNRKKKRIDMQHAYHQNNGNNGLNDRNIVMGAAITANYDEYDNMANAIDLNEKYKIHTGQTGEYNIENIDLETNNPTPEYNMRTKISMEESAERARLDNDVQNVNVITSGMQNLKTRESIAAQVNSGVGNNKNFEASHQLDAWLDDLQAAGAKIVLVTYPRTANNDKELSVVRGEYLEILDDTRKWWKARNIHGEIAHVPHTIVTPFNHGGLVDNNKQDLDFQRQQENYNSIQHSSANDNNEDSGQWIRNKHLGKKGEFRYF